MKRVIKPKAGDIIKIPFRDGYHTYARLLAEGSYAVYDCKSEIERTDYENIVRCDILFIARVDVFAIREGYWAIVANIPLEDTLKDFSPTYFNPAPANEFNVMFYNLKQEAIEDAIKRDWIKTGKLQLDGIHGRIHVASRINDFYDNKRNEFNAMEIWVFKKYLGLPVDDINK